MARFNIQPCIFKCVFILGYSDCFWMKFKDSQPGFDEEKISGARWTQKTFFIR